MISVAAKLPGSGPCRRPNRPQLGKTGQEHAARRAAARRPVAVPCTFPKPLDVKMERLRRSAKGRANLTKCEYLDVDPAGKMGQCGRFGCLDIPGI